MQIKYIEKRFSQKSLKTIQQTNRIIESYLAQDLILTLRQIYYRFVATDSFPDDRKWSWTGSRWVRDPNGTKNAPPNYKWLGTIINNGRLAGLIDWDAIEDRGRNLNEIPSWNSPASIISAAADSYAIDLWQNQKHRVECWVEKQALESVIEQAAEPLACPSIACKGYMSQSEMWQASQRFLQMHKYGQIPIIIYLGDHDPSGLDMNRDIEDRLEIFGIRMTVNRIALNMDQIQQYNPPPNPAKLTDTRAQNYIANYGSNSWELDALEPVVLRDLIQQAIKKYCDMNKFQKMKKRQEKERELLSTVSSQWEDVVEYLGE